MKRVLILILAFLYLAVASGVTVSLHYCMGDLANVEYGIPADEDCSKCGMKEKAGCCHTESKFVKIQDEHQWVKASFSLSETAALVPNQYVNIEPFVDSNPLIALQYHSPPDSRVNEVYLYNSVFRI